ncbi:MAG: LysE family translocator [Mucilaginibacter sp.]
MFGFQNPYLFFITTLLLNLTPGNDVLYVASRSISYGVRAGIVSALGIFTGCFVHILAATLGLSIIISKSACLFQLIKYAGAAYLIYIGIKALLSKQPVDPKNQKKGNADYLKLYKQGMLTNILNPKVAIFFLSFLPQFINPASSYFKVQLFTLGAWFDVQGTIVLILMACLLGKTKDFFSRNPRVWAIQEKITGFILIGLGIRIGLMKK